LLVQTQVDALHAKLQVLEKKVLDDHSDLVARVLALEAQVKQLMDPRAVGSLGAKLEYPAPKLIEAKHREATSWVPEAWQ
jgi:hypothetical protein